MSDFWRGFEKRSSLHINISAMKPKMVLPKPSVKPDHLLPLPVRKAVSK